MSAIIRNFTPVSAWADRWTKPTMEKLLEPLKEHHRQGLEHLLEQAETLDRINQSLIWYGPSWKWTIQLSLVDDQSNDQTSLGYLVPNLERPIVCIPLDESMLSALPSRRLGRFINEGIRSAKCAVAVHWATWTPNSFSEVKLLADLMKRKVKIILAAQGTGK